jgi:V8-like Glu-specific endopeptidase
VSDSILVDDLANLPAASGEFRTVDQATAPEMDVEAPDVAIEAAVGVAAASTTASPGAAGGCSTVANTGVFPFAAVAFLRINLSGGSFRGTGFFVTDRHVLTAGHCVQSRFGAVTSVDVYPGFNAGGRPGINTTVFRPSDGYLSDPNEPSNDFGIVVLPAGAMSVAFGFDIASDLTLQSGPVRLQGYPIGTTRQVDCTGGVAPSSISSTLFSYGFSTDDGESGAPVWPDNPSYAVVAGIHIGSLSGQPTARRFDAAMLAEVGRWLASL